VVEVFQKGYSMYGRVLRPAMVVVSSGGPELAASAKE
jgi:molecular chaperone GrpE (heat shock protein)